MTGLLRASIAFAIIGVAIVCIVGVLILVLGLDNMPNWLSRFIAIVWTFGLGLTVFGLVAFMLFIGMGAVI